MVTEFTELLFEMIKSLEMDSDGVFSIVNFINANEMYTYNGKFYVICIFPVLKKIIKKFS